MGPVDCPETTVRNYHHSLRNDSEERSPQIILVSEYYFAVRLSVL
jgi:hypothetical protein